MFNPHRFLQLRSCKEFYSQKLLAYSRTHPTVSFEVVPEAGPDALMNDEADILVVNKKLTDETNFVVRPFMQNLNSGPFAPRSTKALRPSRTVDNLKKHTGLLLKPKLIFLSPDSFIKVRSNLIFCNGRLLFLTHDQLAIKKTSSKPSRN